MRKKLTVRDMAQIAMFAVIIAVCAWIAIPTAVPFTLQTFGVFAALGLLGGRRGTIAVSVYVLLGAVGLPVFAGFNGGIGALLGPTGGYILGFLLTGLIYWLLTTLAGSRPAVMAAGMLLGLLSCYAFGTLWFMRVSARSGNATGLAAALSWCVFPFIAPDLCKLALALYLTRTIPRHTSAFSK